MSADKDELIRAAKFKIDCMSSDQLKDFLGIRDNHLFDDGRDPLSAYHINDTVELMSISNTGDRIPTGTYGTIIAFIHTKYNSELVRYAARVDMGDRIIPRVAARFMRRVS